MVVPFFIYSAATGLPLEGVDAEFVQFRRRNEAGTITDLDDPIITERSDGLYEFEILDADLTAGSVISYIIDCTAAAASRYLEDHVRADTAPTVENLSSATPLQTFDVTADDVRRHHFAHLSSYDTTTSPTEATVTEMIRSAAAKLSGKLRLKSIEATAIEDTDTPAFIWCADTLRLDVATRISPKVSGIDPEEHQRRIDELKDRYRDLAEGGVDALGEGATADETDSEPEGPITHFTENSSIDVQDDDDASSSIPALRYDDEF